MMNPDSDSKRRWQKWHQLWIIRQLTSIITAHSTNTNMNKIIFPPINYFHPHLLLNSSAPSLVISWPMLSFSLLAILIGPPHWGSLVKYWPRDQQIKSVRKRLLQPCFSRSFWSRPTTVYGLLGGGLSFNGLQHELWYNTFHSQSLGTFIL